MEGCNVFVIDAAMSWEKYTTMEQEMVLQFIWNNKFLLGEELLTTDGDLIEVVGTGEWNRQDGPDFKGACVKIGEQLWGGQIEIHWRASDWYAHQHQYNALYDSVVLHVVYEFDCEIYTSAGNRVPCLELRNYIHPTTLFKYRHLMSTKEEILCGASYNEVKPLVRLLWSERLLVERLERKTGEIQLVLEQYKNHWEEAFYLFFARYLGGTANKLAFEMLANAMPLGILAKHKNSLFQLEALLFGTAGLLHAPKDAYQTDLAKEYRFLQAKYQLSPISGQYWSFKQLRPYQFPTLRIAQLAQLVHQSSGLFLQLLDANMLASARNMLRVGTSAYWDTHYVFGTESAKAEKKLGDDAINSLLINVLAPFMFAYGAYKGDTKYQEKALRWLEDMPAEKNSVIKQWSKLDEVPLNAFQSQALLQQKKEYCDKKRCLECAIGCNILKSLQTLNNSTPVVRLVEANEYWHVSTYQVVC